MKNRDQEQENQREIAIHQGIKRCLEDGHAEMRERVLKAKEPLKKDNEKKKLGEC